MLRRMARDWWLFALRGVAAIAFGILALIWPDKTLTVLVILFGAYAIVDGVALLAALIRGDELARSYKWLVGLMGVLGIVIGVVTFIYPGLTVISLLAIIASWAIVMGALQIVMAFRVRGFIPGESWMILGGLLSIAFGVLLIAFPNAGLTSIVWMIGLWAIAFGFSSLGLAQRLHRIDSDLHKLIPLS